MATPALDLPLVLSYLRPGQNWGPCAQTGTDYATFSAGWRDPNPCPTLDELNAAWTQLQTDHPELFSPIIAARQRAVVQLMTRPDDLGIALRTIIMDLYTQINTMKRAAGIATEDQPTILARLESGIQAGEGDPQAT